jgi:hypothetical protein
MSGRSGRTITIATLAAICIGLAIAPQAALGKGTVKFAGPVALERIPDPTGFPRSVPAIELKVSFQGKAPKVVPGGTVRTEGLYGPCLPTSGCEVFCLDTGTCDYNPLCFANLGNEDETGSFDDIKVKKNRTFSGILRAAVTTSAGSSPLAINTARITGKVTKRSVTGTVRAYAHREAFPGPKPGSMHPPMTCDTGVLNYTATK